MLQTAPLLRGRLVSLSSTPPHRTLTIAMEKKRERITLQDDPAQKLNCEIGDIVEINLETHALRVLTKTARPGSAASEWLDHVRDPRRQHAIATRTRVEGLIRSFFLNQSFVETRTPLLVPCPGMEIHIRPFALECGAYLPTSPEFAMKRLLVGGLERIFQIAPAFRYEPHSRTHHPEFTLLEWYRAYADLAAIMEDTEQLFEYVALALFGKPEISYQGRTISVQTPWPRKSVRELFKVHAGFDLGGADLEKLRVEARRLGLTFQSTDTWDDLYFRIWLNRIEPHLPADRAVFVHHYPKSQAALAVLDTDDEGNIWAKRFEIYAGGIELGNAFEELTDAAEQRARFVRDMAERQAIYDDRFPPSPLDEEFLAALEMGMPPSGGIAIGVDRMVMLFADENDIDYTQWLRPFPGTHPVPPSI